METRISLGIFIQRVVDLVDGQAVVIRRLVVTHAAGCAAVIPQHEDVAVGRVTIDRPVDEIVKRLLVAHILPRVGFHIVERVVTDGEAVDGFAVKSLSSHSYAPPACTAMVTSSGRSTLAISYISCTQ